MFFVRQALLFLLLIHCSRCRDIWSADLPEVSGLTLEKGKPIQLPKNYESVQISGLEGTLFSDSLSQLHGVKVLRIRKHKLQTIENGALCSAPDVKILELDFYDAANTSLRHLTKGMFENCDQIEELIIKFSDEIENNIDTDAFENIKNLKKFILQSYKIPHLKKGFFKLNKSLKEIVFSFNYIEQIDSDVFQDFKDIETIRITHNRNWTHLSKNTFENLQKLTTIQLRDNSLKDLTWDEFDGLNKVKNLDVASNRISSFNAEKIAKYMPNLETISLELNALSCKESEAFVEELTKKLDHPLDATYKFDPGYYDSCEQND